MAYQIHVINTKNELSSCPVFHVDQFNWGGDYRPESFGQLAYIKDTGFYLKMTCMEANPVCHYHKDSEPVYLDSAMEAFLALSPVAGKEDSDYYFNFEFNSAGALLAKFGNERHGRKFFSEEDLAVIERKVDVKEEQWEITLLFPKEVLTKYFPDFNGVAGTKIRLNFFKLAEGEEMTHFASYSPIHSPKPDFHLPQYFAEGIFTED